jgi:hypothetical protein
MSAIPENAEVDFSVKKDDVVRKVAEVKPKSGFRLCGLCCTVEELKAAVDVDAIQKVVTEEVAEAVDAVKDKAEEVVAAVVEAAKDKAEEVVAAAVEAVKDKAEEVAGTIKEKVDTVVAKVA